MVEGTKTQLNLTEEATNTFFHTKMKKTKLFLSSFSERGCDSHFSNPKETDGSAQTFFLFRLGGGVALRLGLPRRPAARLARPSAGSACRWPCGRWSPGWWPAAGPRRLSAVGRVRQPAPQRRGWGGTLTLAQGSGGAGAQGGLAQPGQGPWRPSSPIPAVEVHHRISLTGHR